jgi:hypothetical protein
VLDLIYSNKNISRQIKNIGIPFMMESMRYSSEIWTINAKMKRRHNSLEMVYLRRSEGISR